MLPFFCLWLLPFFSCGCCSRYMRRAAIVHGQQGHKDVVTLLTRHHADVDKASTNGATPLYAAARVSVEI